MERKAGRTKVLIAAKERDVRDQIRRLILTDEQNVDVAGTATDGMEAVQIAVQMRPNIAIIKENLPIFNGLQTSEMISLAAPEVKCLLVSERQAELPALGAAMKSGIRGWIVYPFQDSTLVKSIRQLIDLESIRDSTEFNKATDPRNLSKIIVVTGGKGGVGKTTIATCLATYLASRHPDKVALVDMYTQFGDVGLMMSVTPTRSIVDMAPAAEELDTEIVEGYMLSHSSGVKVLIGSSRPEPLDAISPACAESVLHALKTGYTHIVVDLPPILHATTLYIIAHAYKMVLVTTLFDLPSVHDSRQLYEAISGDYLPPEKILLVANRASKFNTMKVEDLVSVYGRPVDAVIPNDNQLITAINRGEPVISAYSHSPLSLAIAGLVEQGIEQDEQGNKGGSAGERPRRRSIFGGRK